ncbi:MAG: hypothetical protein R2795_00620 [Saprospiraceae bacterium]
MKQVVVFFMIFLFFPLGEIEAQSTELLDAKNGYKEFKFGSRYTEFKEDLVFFFEPNEGYKGYEYNGQNHSSFLGTEWESFKPAFYNDKLISLEFYFDSDIQTLQNLLQDLEVLFGEPRLGPLEDELGNRVFDNFFAWRGEKIGLDLTRYSNLYFSESLRNKTVVKIMPLDASLIMLSDDF